MKFNSGDTSVRMPIDAVFSKKMISQSYFFDEAKLCEREGITINIFLLSSWNQSEEDVKFAYRLAENTKGRVFFVAGKDLDRYVVWDYLQRRRSIVS